MIKVSVLYPHNVGSKFDMDYYCNSHIPMVLEKLGAAVKGIAVEQGLGGAEPGSRPTLCHYGISVLRLRGRFSDRIRPPCRGDHERHTQLY